MAFIRLADYECVEIALGARARTLYGARVMPSYLEMDEGCVVPEHFHPHEQAGMLLEGKLELTIGEETRICESGEMFIIPGDVTHSVRPLGGPAVVLDVFSPVREDYAELFNKYVPPAG